MGLGTLMDKLRAAAGSRGYTCDGCGKEIFDYPNRRFCVSCEESIERERGGYRCEKCGRRAVTAGVCLDCKKELPDFSFGVSAFSYRRAVANLLNRFKTGDRYLSFFFADEMSRTLSSALREKGREPFGAEDLFVPVPLSANRLRERGYNQSEELCKTLSRLTGAPWEKVLRKTRETAPQKTLTGSDRKRNVSGAFRVVGRKLCAGRRIFLTDDVMTTGATGSECARVLRNAGAKEVIFLTAAALPERKIG